MCPRGEAGRAIFIAGALVASGLVPSGTHAQSLGELVHDGPPTPEQISLYLPVEGAVAATRASVRYRASSDSAWRTGHPLHRIRPAYADVVVADAFAGVITGLQPGETYTIGVTVAGFSERTLVHTTRALPPSAGPATVRVSSGATPAEIQAAFDGLVPGDVLELAEGEHDLTGVFLNRGGTEASPIYIRGADRDGTVLHAPSGHVLYLLDASNVVIEDLTLVGSGVDSGTDASSEGIRFWNGERQRNVTIRRVTMRGVDKGVVAEHGLEGALVYDSSLAGNDPWERAFLETNIAWNDDGIRLPGSGNAAFNNTLSGFGDAFAVNDGVENVGVHFFRNEVLWTCDDAFEGDYGVRNLTFYDNRIQNSMTLASFDPLHGGPAYVFRNVAINTGRGPYKLNNQNTGHLFYNNTVVRTVGTTDWGWVQYNNGEQRAWAYRNNILIYHGVDRLLAMEAGGQDPIDFTNNAWYPDAAVWWTTTGGSYTTMAEARAHLAPTTPLFGTSGIRHDADLIAEPDPFADDVILGSSYLVRVTEPYTPALASDSVLREAGVAIPGITDGYTGAAPDMGAILTGVRPPEWGDRAIRPAAPTNLSAS